MGKSWRKKSWKQINFFQFFSSLFQLSNTLQFLRLSNCDVRAVSHSCDVFTDFILIFICIVLLNLSLANMFYWFHPMLSVLLILCLANIIQWFYPWLLKKLRGRSLTAFANRYGMINQTVTDLTVEHAFKYKFVFFKTQWNLANSSS